MLMLSTGRMLKPSTFMYAPKPAICVEPKLFTLDWIIIFDSEMTMLCIPVGRPIFIIFESICPFICISFGDIL